MRRIPSLVASLMLLAAATASASRATESGTAGNRPLPRGNFVVHGATAARGRLILERAENVRGEAYRLLLGMETPEAWRVPCDVHVHASADSFAATLGGPPAAARGATSLDFAAARVTRRRIDVMGDGSDVVPDALGHEIVHVVLAERFVDAPPPRWADEGLAILFDPPEAQRRHDADFRAALRLGRAWSAADLLALEEYPPQAARQRVFYGQSAALVRWLVARRDARAFVAFTVDCGPIGTAAALEKHYGLGSVADLEAAWAAQPALDGVALDAPPSNPPRPR